jgi:urea transporter
MNADLVIVLLLPGAAILMFALNRPSVDAVALGSLSCRPGPRVAVYAPFATVLTVIVQCAMVSALTPFGIPTLTTSFVVVTRLFLLPGQKLD